MFRRSHTCTLAWFALSIVVAAPAHAIPFDFIYVDRVDVTTFPAQSGFTLADYGFGLVVNKQPTDIDEATFFGTSFSVTSSVSAVELIPFINNPGPPGATAPIHQDEAVGSVLHDNEVLTGLLLPGETLHNTAPLQVIAFQMNTNGYVGRVTFGVTMAMGEDVAQFVIHALIGEGPDFALAFPSAARVSSVPMATPLRRHSWGGIKARFR